MEYNQIVCEQWAFNCCHAELENVYILLQKHCDICTEQSSCRLDFIEPENDQRWYTGQLSVANGTPSERKVVIGQLANQFLWHICWCGKQIWDGNIVQVDKTDLLHRLHAIDEYNGDFEKLCCGDLYAWDDQDLSYIFAFATNFIIFHEVGHIVMKHDPFDKSYDFKPLPERRKFEVDADNYSMDAIQVVSKKLGMNEIANIGVICAQCLMFFIRKDNVDYDHDTHGDPMDRIQRKFSLMDCDLQPYIGIVNEMKSLANRFLFEKYGTETSYT